MARKALFSCGILSSLLYVSADIFASMLYDGYSYRDQTISELSAIGAPTRSLSGVVGFPYVILLLAFGLGVWVLAQKRNLRITGGLLVAQATLGLVAWPFASMHQRAYLAAAEGTLTDSLHIALAVVTVLLMLGEIGFSYNIFGKRFRFYSIGTIVMLTLFGILAFLQVPRITEGLPTPWLGIYERINVYGYMLWVIVLSIGLLRAPTTLVGDIFHEETIRDEWI